MRVLGAVFVGVGAGLLAGTAAAEPIPIPPLPTTTIGVAAPPVPVPVPAPVPKLPPPVVAAPVNAAPALPGPASSVPAAVGSAGTSPSSSSSSSPFSSSSSEGSARVDHFHSSRRWIGTSGPERRRTTTFTFALQQPGRVVFTVNEVSPVCVGVGRFSVAGHAGLNRVRFAGVVNGRRLPAGTYRIAIRTAYGRTVRRVTLVVVGGSAPSLEELDLLRSANVCRETTSRGSSSAAVAGATAVQPLPQPKTSAESLGPVHGANLHSGVLGSSVAKTARALQPALIALLALAILLLGAASLPREAVPGPRVHDALARHRIELAGLGAAALVAVAIAFLFS